MGSCETRPMSCWSPRLPRSSSSRPRACRCNTSIPSRRAKTSSRVFSSSISSIRSSPVPNQSSRCWNSAGRPEEGGCVTCNTGICFFGRSDISAGGRAAPALRPGRSGRRRRVGCPRSAGSRDHPRRGPSAGGRRTRRRSAGRLPSRRARSAGSAGLTPPDNPPRRGCLPARTTGSHRGPGSSRGSRRRPLLRSPRRASSTSPAGCRRGSAGRSPDRSLCRRSRSSVSHLLAAVADRAGPRVDFVLDPGYSLLYPLPAGLAQLRAPLLFHRLKFYHGGVGREGLEVVRDDEQVLQAYDPGERLGDALLHHFGVGLVGEPGVGEQVTRLPAALDGPSEDGAPELPAWALLEPVEDGDRSPPEVLYADLLGPFHLPHPLY